MLEPQPESLRATRAEGLVFSNDRAPCPVAALEALRELPVGNQREVKRQLQRVISDVAARQGNAPTICRKCYIHPEVMLGYLQGRLADLPRTSTTNALRSLLGKRRLNRPR